MGTTLQGFIIAGKPAHVFGPFRTLVWHIYKKYDFVIAQGNYSEINPRTSWGSLAHPDRQHSSVPGF